MEELKKIVVNLICAGRLTPDVINDKVIFDKDLNLFVFESILKLEVCPMDAEKILKRKVEIFNKYSETKDNPYPEFEMLLQKYPLYEDELIQITEIILAKNGL